MAKVLGKIHNVGRTSKLAGLLKGEASSPKEKEGRPTLPVPLSPKCFPSPPKEAQKRMSVLNAPSLAVQ